MSHGIVDGVEQRGQTLQPLATAGKDQFPREAIDELEAMFGHQFLNLTY